MRSTGDGTAHPAPIGDLVHASARRSPTAPAIRTGDDTLRYADLARVVDAHAGVLAARGVGPGSRVALSAANSVGFVAVVFAAARLGAATVMVSTAWREREVRHAVELTEPTHLVHDGTGAVDPTVLGGTIPLIHLAELASPPSPPDPPAAPTLPDVELDDLAVVFFSSGTTGMPKAVRHSHRTLGHAIDHWSSALGLGATDRLQIATPPFHILGLLNLLVVVATGASVRLHERFDLDAVLTSVERDRVTIEMAVAPIALAMAGHPELERFDLSSLRFILWGATPVSPSVADTVTRRSGVRFLAGYGASELPVLSVNPVDRPEAWRLDSVGVPPAGVELRVVDLETGAELPAGRPGEIEGRSASTMLGYLPEAANDEAFHDGWYRTGDVGTIDADGWVTITDRVKEMIKVKGFQVAPAEIEEALVAHQDVADCAVFGVADPAVGERVVAAAVARQGTDLDAGELIAYAGAQLATYKQISELIVVDRIPRLPSGKVLRRELQANHRS